MTALPTNRTSPTGPASPLNSDPEFFFQAEEMPKEASRSNSENSIEIKDESPVIQTNPEFADVIDAVNALHNSSAACGVSLDVKLPRIVVIGPESGGKSSALQAIVGKEVLPKGSGLVTRRPTIIQLIPITENEEYGIFMHVPKEGDREKRFYDFAAIAKEIEDETNRNLGPKCFSSEPINLRIYSPKVLKLTLVDLPGIVQIPVVGQDDGSVKSVEDMVLEEIKNERTIILAIIPANQSITGSVALKVAKIVDPNYERTIGVLTKLDIMDAGTNALNTLENREVVLKRGYVGIVNAGQADVDKKTSIATILEKERKFFQQSCYSHLAHRMGIPYLQMMLQKTLRQHIKEGLPELRKDLSLQLSKITRELKEFNKRVGQGKEGGNHFYIIKLVQKFIRIVCINLFGYSTEVSSEKIESGGNIHHKLYTEVQTYLNLDLQPDKKELTIMIANLTALRNSIAVPSQSMDALCRKLVSKFKEPLQLSLNCIKQVLVDSVIESTEMLQKYPSLKNEVIYRVQCCINQLTELAEERLISHVDAEMFYVNTAHPDFDGSEWNSIAPIAGCVGYLIKSDSAAKQVVNSAAKQVVNSAAKLVTNSAAGIAIVDLMTMLMSDEPEQKKTEYVSSMMVGYLKIVKKSISDLAIKYISYFLVKKFGEYLEENLVTELLESTNLQLLLKDCEEDFKQKADMERKCIKLQEALDRIQAF